MAEAYQINMKDCGKDLYEEWMEKKTIPEILGIVKKYTGYDGEFNIKYKPRLLNLSGPYAETVINTNTGEVKRHKISIRKPSLESNSPWDVFFYGWTLTGEALHIANNYNPENNLSSERKVHITALFLIDRYMRGKYPAWYRSNKRVLEGIKKNITFMKVD